MRLLMYAGYSTTTRDSTFRDIPPYLPTVFVRHYLFGMQDSFKKGQGLVSFLQGLFHRHTAIAFERWTTKRANIVTFGTEESCKFLRSIYPSNRIEYLPTKPLSVQYLRMSKREFTQRSE